MKLVQFANGKYGIEKTSMVFFKEYLDLKNLTFWWSKHNSFFLNGDCEADKEEVEKIFNRTIIK